MFFVGTANVYATDDLVNGINAANSNNCNEAMLLLAPFEMSGDTNAQRALAYCYVVTGDYTHGISLFEKTGEKGDVLSQVNLGKIFSDGEIATKDFKKAAYWYEKSAEQGHLLSQYNLGILYLKGLGGIKNEERGLYWLTKAAESDVNSQAALASYYIDIGTPEGRKKGVYWFIKAIEKGDSNAQYFLGTMYSSGNETTPQSHQKALDLYLAAADQGHPGALYRLAVMYFNGWALDQNFSEAYFYCYLAAKKGFEEAKQNLPVIKNTLSPQEQYEVQKRLLARK